MKMKKILSIFTLIAVLVPLFNLSIIAEEGNEKAAGGIH